MKNIISYSLYGTDNTYWHGAIKNIDLAKNIYPNYICRFYIDKDAPEYLKNTIVGENVEVILMPNRGGTDGMFWRFLAAADKDVDVCLCRDVDSAITYREKMAVEEWLKSDKNFHIMRDHKYHKIEILGGMWGCRNGILYDIDLYNLIQEWPNYHKINDDQKFLRSKIYPKVKNSCLEHSSYGIKYENPIHPFPTQRESNLDYACVQFKTLEK